MKMVCLSCVMLFKESLLVVDHGCIDRGLLLSLLGYLLSIKTVMNDIGIEIFGEKA